MAKASLNTGISVVRHAPGAPGLRLIGLGPRLLPRMGLVKLEMFLKKHAFWANNRKKNDLRQMLANSSVVISLWKKRQIIGFGRATSDSIYRAVLWDVVVADEVQGLGLGKIVVNALLEAPAVKNTERVYLMTTNSQEFYEQLGFQKFNKQSLMIRSIKD